MNLCDKPCGAWFWMKTALKWLFVLCEMPPHTPKNLDTILRPFARGRQLTIPIRYSRVRCPWHDKWPELAEVSFMVASHQVTCLHPRDHLLPSSKQKPCNAPSGRSWPV